LYGKDFSVGGTALKLPAFTDGLATDQKNIWKRKPANPLLEDLDRLTRQIGKLVDEGLTCFDLVACLTRRRIQPLQHRDNLMHEYTWDKDKLWVSEVDLQEATFQLSMKNLVKNQDPETRDVPGITKDMYEMGQCPKVSRK
jgi:hypothetical protein